MNGRHITISHSGRLPRLKARCAARHVSLGRGHGDELDVRFLHLESRCRRLQSGQRLAQLVEDAFRRPAPAVPVRSRSGPARGTPPPPCRRGGDRRWPAPLRSGSPGRPEPANGGSEKVRKCSPLSRLVEISPHVDWSSDCSARTHGCRSTVDRRALAWRAKLSSITLIAWRWTRSSVSVRLKSWSRASVGAVLTCAALEPGVDCRLTTMLTRRFSACAAAEVLGTTGWYWPYPMATTRSGFTPSIVVRRSTTVEDRAADNAQLLA